MSPIADNNVEIVVTGTDRTDPLWAKVKDKAKAGGKTAGEAMSAGAASTSADATRAGDKLGDGMLKGVLARLRGGRDQFITAGDAAGMAASKGTRRGFLAAGIGAASDFAGGLFSKLPGLLSNHKVAAPIAAGVAAGAPLIAAAVSGAVLAGLSTGVVAGGVAIAFKDPTVKAEATALGDFIGKEMQQAAGSFVQPTRQALALVRTEWAGIDDDISGAFRAAARYVVPLTQGVMDTLEAVGPGLRKAVEGAEPVINMISKELPQMGKAVGDMFEHMGENGEDSAVALGVVFNTMTSSIELIDTAITGLTKSFGTLTDFIQGIDKVTPDWTPVGAAADWLNEKLAELRGETEGTAGVFIQVKEATEGSQHAMDAMAERAEILGGSMADAVEQAGSLKDALDVLNGGFIDSREAERNYQEAIDDLNKSIKENGKTLDVNTRKGRENQENLDQLAQSVSNQMNAVYQQTEATRGSAAAQKAANAVYERGRAQLVAVATKLLGSKAAAERYADSILGIPKKWNTDIDSNAAQARDQAREAGRAVRSIPTSWTTYLNVVNRNYGGNSVTGAQETGGVVGSAQTGGVRANRTLVGEAGPEILDLAPGTRVYSAPDTQRMMAAGGGVGGTDGAALGGGKLEVRARFDPNASDQLQRAIADVIRLEVWRSGGTEGIGGSRWSPRRG